MNTRLEKVLVAIHPGSTPSTSVIDHARWLAARLDGEMRFVSCLYDTVIAVGLVNEDDSAIAAQVGMVNTQRQILDEIADSVDAVKCTVDSKVCWGIPYRDVIRDEARSWSADLVIVGAPHPGIRTSIGLQGFGMNLAPRCPCPVLLVKNAETPRYDSILAAIDPLHRHNEPSGIDDRVLDAATQLARTTNSPLSVIHVYPNPESFELASSVEVLPGVHYGTENIESVHREATIEVAARYGITTDSVHLAAGDPAENIADQIRELRSDLIVLGAIKRGRLEEAILGSTAERVASEAECDVLLVGDEET